VFSGWLFTYNHVEKVEQQMNLLNELMAEMLIMSCWWLSCQGMLKPGLFMLLGNMWVLSTSCWLGDHPPLGVCLSESHE